MNSREESRKRQKHSQQNQADLSQEQLLLSVPQAAHLLNIGETFCWAMIHKGEIPTVRLGRRVLIPRVWLEKLITSLGQSTSQ